tara:strand:- start:1961 stop:3133 length:1173 start_codon:yes stop_codon:yes gene_type:complete
MMVTVASRIEAIAPSATIEVSRKVKALINDGVDVINLAGGEPFFDTPGYIRKAAEQALNSGMNRYEGSRGALALREAVSNDLLTNSNIPAHPIDNILITPGSKQGLMYSLMTVLEPGDEVIIPEPYWVSYPSMVSLASGVPVALPANPEDGFALNLERLSEFTTKKTKALILNSPNNPSGKIVTRDELLGLIEWMNHHDVVVICDEIYNRLLFDVEHVSLASFPEVAERVITVNGFSKTYAMTGWRLGYVVGPKKFIDSAVIIQEQIATSVCNFAQYGALAAITERPSFVREMSDEYRKHRQLLIEAINQNSQLKACPCEGTFYLFVDASSYGLSSQEICNRFLSDAGISTMPGSVFGDSGEGYLRMSFSVSEEALLKLPGRLSSLTPLP